MEWELLLGYGEGDITSPCEGLVPRAIRGNPTTFRMLASRELPVVLTQLNWWCNSTRPGQLLLNHTHDDTKILLGSFELEVFESRRVNHT